MRLLNVGSGGSKEVTKLFKDWEQDSLDIDAKVNPDIVCDAKELRKLKPGQYDAVYNSHNLEHFYKHEVPVVLSGFLHVLKSGGFAYIAVPDIMCLFEQVRGRDIDDTWYKASGSNISFHDVMFGWAKQVSSGNLYYAHKTAFSEKSLAKACRAAGFKTVLTAPDNIGNIFCFAFKTKPSRDKLRRLGL